MSTTISKTPFNLSSDLGRVFAWLTRNDMGRKFGTLPIGWYQIHQCHAITVLEEKLVQAGLPKDAPMRVKLGNVQAKAGQKWVRLCSAVDVFQAADNRSRQ